MRSAFIVSISILASTFTLAATIIQAEQSQPLLRFPDIHGDQVAFVHADEVWTAPVAGGPALRLTDDAGQDRHPKFSADGSQIAWTSEAGGNSDVWVMGSDGSQPQRLTFHPGNDEVVGWHAGWNKIIFRSTRMSWSRFDRLFVISPDGSGLEVLPLHEAGRGDFSPDGRFIVYNRIAREDRTWKRYYGGMAQDLWLYELETASDRRLTDWKGTDRLPMWLDDLIYFASDRNGELNLFTYNLDNDSIDQVTEHQDWDIRRPSTDGQRIVYELGGDLWLFDPATRTSRQLAIEIQQPAFETRPYWRSVDQDISDVAIAPEGGRVMVCARGEVFSVPVEHGATRNLTRTPGARDRNAVWSPDGATVAWISDADGESDIWTASAADGSNPRRITDLGPGYRHTLLFSPDSSMIAFTDQTLSLAVLTLADGSIRKIDTSEREAMDVSLEAKRISDAAWSPDSRFLAYSKIGLEMVSQVWIFDLTNNQKHKVSNGQFNDFQPTFTADGQHLLLISNRRFEPTLGDFEWEMVYKKIAGVYAITLTKNGRALLPLLSDEVAPVPKANGHADEDPPPVTVQIDWDRIASRIEALPVARGNYRQLDTVGDRILWLDGPEGDYNPFEFREMGSQNLYAFDLNNREAEIIQADVTGYSVATDGEHVAWWADDTIGVIKLKTGALASVLKAMSSHADSADETIDLAGLEVEIEPRAEWRQVYNEAWRMQRDFYYEPAMKGLDWKAVGAKYSALVDRATCAQDLRFIIGELIGELATSHTYVGAGDRRREAESVEVGLLAVDWTAAHGRWQISHIYDVPDWSREVVPPLARPGVNVEVGDYLLEVNGIEVNDQKEVYAWFQGLAEVPVTLTVNDSPKTEGARQVVVEPLSSERWPRYHAWVEHNRQRVSEASDGRLGYLHLPDTYLGSATEFAKGYYSQVMKEGLVIDGRFNGGGLDPDIFLARLAKKPMAYWTRRYSADQTTPWYVSDARMVCITNRQAGSGGDELPFEFRQKGMGPVIGTRTWGGLVGVSMSLTMMDGSYLTSPDYRVYTPDGQWTVENEGVTPDIEVELDPAEMARGYDAQLEKAIEVVLARLIADPVVAPTHPPFPKRDELSID